MRPPLFAVWRVPIRHFITHIRYDTVQACGTELAVPYMDMYVVGDYGNSGSFVEAYVFKLK